jgi:hypothetical protein
MPQFVRYGLRKSISHDDRMRHVSNREAGHTWLRKGVHPMIRGNRYDPIYSKQICECIEVIDCVAGPSTAKVAKRQRRGRVRDFREAIFMGARIYRQNV